MTVERFFNTAGPVNCENHYCLSPIHRFNLDEVESLIAQQKYFVLHAPRQTGKTSSLLALRDYLNEQGTYAALYINIESAQAARENVSAGMKSILYELSYEVLDTLGESFLTKRRNEILDNVGAFDALHSTLRLCAELIEKPLAVFIDEVDSLVGDTLISLLRQLRAGYSRRPQYFPQSIILCGVRDVRDYRIHSSAEKTVITGGSAFNIKAASLRLGDFTRPEVDRLYQCHADTTGQRFTSEAIDLVWEFSEGQPWLVNALGYEVCFTMKAGLERTKRITPEMVRQAKENLILRRETHIDQLVDKLKEERVRRVIEPILAGVEQPEDYATDDLMYVRDLGLIKIDRTVRIANRLYQEVIPRELTYVTQHTISHETQWYINPQDGSLDMSKLLTAFQEFFRKHSEHWVERFQYKEAGPQLLMQAFLSRIVNGGGRIEREYGLGKQRTDLLLVWPYQNSIQEVALELKIRYGALDTTFKEGLKQTWKYMDTCGTTDGHLIVFDRSPATAWENKIFRREEAFEGHPVTVWGM